MKIKSIACEQFAGIRDRKVELTEGVNVIYGKNESGKSTLANLLSSTLFQSAKVGNRENNDKEFRKRFFPGEVRNGRKGDSADGTVVFTTESGEYRLSKTWGKDAYYSALDTPTGKITNEETINKILREELQYGAGVYADLLLTSQSSTDAALKTLLDAAQKTEAKTEVVNAVSQAFAESDGVSADAIEEKIAENIKQLGNHWDLDRQKPTRTSKGEPRSKGKGKVEEAYYQWEDAEAALSRLSHLEEEVERTAKTFAECDRRAGEAETEYRNFQQFYGRLDAAGLHKKNIEMLNEKLTAARKDLEDWPQLEVAVKNAERLQTELTQCNLSAQYQSAKKLEDDRRQLTEALSGTHAPNAEEIRTAEKLSREVATLENKLCGMNLTAAISMLGEHTLEITSVRTGEPVSWQGGTAAIQEAVNVCIPGVMTMQLAPANVDAAAVQAEIQKKQQEMHAAFTKYGVDSVQEMKDRLADAEQKKNLLALVVRELNTVLGETNFAVLQANAAALPAEIRSKEEIEREITLLCGGKNLTAFLSVQTTKLGNLTEKYGSATELKAKIFDWETEKAEEEKASAQVEDIPAEYASIDNPKTYQDTLQKRYEQMNQEREQARDEKTRAFRDLESYQADHSDDLQASLENAERELEDKKTLLAHWLHIQQVFLEQKESVQDTPMVDIAESFAHYLGVISHGQIDSEFPAADRLEMNVYSNDRLLDYEKLSEGTKETVSLAFRLAVLDHLFPQGGLIVLDDPFTDMDAERTEQACALVQECARRHQVLFLTCNEQYLQQLGGNSILL